jgi:hypothetical protein
MELQLLSSSSSSSLLPWEPIHRSNFLWCRISWRKQACGCLLGTLPSVSLLLLSAYHGPVRPATTVNNTSCLQLTQFKDELQPFETAPMATIFLYVFPLSFPNPLAWRYETRFSVETVQSIHQLQFSTTVALQDWICLFERRTCPPRFSHCYLLQLRIGLYSGISGFDFSEWPNVLAGTSVVFLSRYTRMSG